MGKKRVALSETISLWSVLVFCDKLLQNIMV